MSHFPKLSASRYLSSAVSSNDGYASFTGRVQLCKPYTSQVATCYASASFVVPAVGQTVTVPVVDSTYGNLSVGDYVSVGTSLGWYSSSNVSSNPVTFSQSTPGSYSPGTIVAGNYPVVTRAGAVTSITTNQWTLPGSAAVPKASINVASLAVLQANIPVMFTNWAGVYRVVNVPSSFSLTLQLVSPGDLPPGTTCINSLISLGTDITHGYPLGIVPRLFGQFNPTVFYPTTVSWTVVSLSNAGTTAPVVSIGFSPNSDPNTGRGYFGDLVNAQALPAANSTSVGNIGTMSLQPIANAGRIGVLPGMPLMAFLKTPANTTGDYTIAVRVRGFYSQV